MTTPASPPQTKDWSAKQYLKFEDERTRAARDLLAQVPLTDAKRIVDLGCGPGNSTELLIRRFPQAEVIGVDSSPDMLRQARERLPQNEFIQADLSSWKPQADTDLLFANAVFQWVPDHLSVLRRLVESLPQGSVLAVQMPDNLDEPSHVAMREVATSGPWAEMLADAVARRKPLPRPEVYYDSLKPLCARVDVWHAIYNHPLASAEAIVEWVKGTGLRRFVDPLDDEQRADFLKRYTAQIEKTYAVRVDGKRFYRFPRLFIVAIR